MFKLPGFNSKAHLFRSECDPDKRDKEYYLCNVQSLYSDYLRGTSSVGYAGLNRIAYLRDLAEGNNPFGSDQKEDKAEPQRAILDVNGNPIQYDSEAYPEINHSHEVWDIISPACKIMDAMDGMLSKAEFDIACDPLDPNTRQKIEDEKLFAWQYAQGEPQLKLAAKVAGVPLTEPNFVPQTEQDMDGNEEYFLPDHCRYIELVVKHSFDISHWSTDIKKLFVRDLITLGFASVRNVYDPADGKVKPRYVNPGMGADIQSSDYIDCHDSERAWEFELVPISILRQYFPDKDEEWFKKIAGTYAGQFGNPDIDTFKSSYTVQDSYGRWRYDQFKALVFNAEWIDIDKSKEAVGTKHGRKTVKQVPLSKKVAQDKTVRFAEQRIRHDCRWVVGTEDIFEYGPAYNITEPQPGDTELTYKWIVLKGKSKVEQLAPILRNFQSLWDQWRKLLKNARGNGIAVDVDMMASTAGQTDNPQSAAMKSFRRYLETYVALIRRVNAAGMQSQAPPIMDIPGGMGALFTELMAAFQQNIQMAEYITGLNPLTLGQSADPNAPVTTSQLAVNATNNVIRPIMDGYMRCKQMVAENLARWIVVIVRGERFSRMAYQQIIGEYGVECLIAANKEESAYGFKLTPRPTDMEKQWLLQNLQIASTPGPGGEREISTADATRIIIMIAADTPMKTVLYYMERARKKQREAMMEEKTALMQQQSKLNQQDAQISGQRRMEEVGAQHQAKMQQIAAANEGLIRNSEVQENIRREKEREVAQIKTGAQVKKFKAQDTIKRSDLKVGEQYEVDGQMYRYNGERLEPVAAQPAAEMQV